MTFPASQVPEENPGRTDTDAQADGEATSDAGRVAYAPPLPVPSAGTAASLRWSRIQAMFVDDPRGSVTQAAAMADEAIEAFIAAARERQAWLASSWQGRDAGTEELRTALQDYRAFLSSVTVAPQPA